MLLSYPSSIRNHYATSTTYSRTLKAYIDTYDLTQFDVPSDQAKAEAATLDSVLKPTASQASFKTGFDDFGITVPEAGLPKRQTNPVVAGLLAAMVGECLVRGLVCGNVRRRNRVAAYAAAAAVFAAMHVLSYLGQMDALTLGYNIRAYAMPSIALCACYECAGNIWAPIGLHMIINALGMSAM